MRQMPRAPQKLSSADCQDLMMPDPCLTSKKYGILPLSKSGSASPSCRMAIFVRILRHTFRYPLQSSLSLMLAIACTLLVLVLPGITCVHRRIIGKNVPTSYPDRCRRIGAILLRQALFTLRTYLNNILELKLTHRIRLELYDKLQRLPVKWFDSNSSGEIMSRVANDVPATNRVIIDGVDLAIAALLQFLVVLGYMFWLSWELTLITLIPFPLIAALTAWWTRRSEPMWRESSEAKSALNAILTTTSRGSARSKPIRASRGPWTPSMKLLARSEKST